MSSISEFRSWNSFSSIIVGSYNNTMGWDDGLQTTGYSFLPPSEPRAALLWALTKHGGTITQKGLFELQGAISATNADFQNAIIALEKANIAIYNEDTRTFTKQDNGQFQEFFAQISKA